MKKQRQSDMILDYLRALLERGIYYHPSAAGVDSRTRRVNCEEMALIIYRDIQAGRVIMKVDESAVKRARRRAREIDEAPWNDVDAPEEQMTVKELLALENKRKKKADKTTAGGRSTRRKQRNS